MHGTACAMLAFVALAGQSDFLAGAARRDITPAAPVLMSGYSVREHAAEGTLHKLWAKALALGDGRGGRIVFVTMDLIGLPAAVHHDVCLRAAKQYGLTTDQLLLNASHTHSGPIVWPHLQVLFEFDAEQRQRLLAYRERLVNDLVAVIGAALADLQPSTLAIGHGKVGFAVNRRQHTAHGYGIGVAPDGPTAHDVPVLRIAALDGRLRAVLFGYACHNTTITGTCYQFNGDYAGFAQLEVEKAAPGAAAMFLQLCGADQNPRPRGTVELAAQHGTTLGREVARVLAGKMTPIAPLLRTAYAEVKLPFEPHERAMFEQELKGDNAYARRRAALMLATLDAGQPVNELTLPVQAVRFGDGVALLGIGGEVVVDYALRLQREHPQLDLIVAGYTNEVPCYIPSRRVLKEGGYEAANSMLYYGQPGPLTEVVEQNLIDACRRLLAQVGVKEPTAASRQ